MVLANDIDNKRCYMLVHQAKRLHSPYFVIINHDSGALPNFYHNQNGQKELLKFDRILCDAPCTGDGTVRKNYDIWTKWSVAHGLNFHRLQTRIAKRCLELLVKDGLMVYSTCSLNPMEDEAVVASLITQSKGGLELVDVQNKLPGLKYMPGLTNWVVMQKNLKIVSDISEVDQEHSKYIQESMFPPQDKSLNLHRCIRILPHLQNTGGFFVAVLKKTVEKLDWEAVPFLCCSQADDLPCPTDRTEIIKARSYRRQNKRMRKELGFKEDPFYFFTKETQEWVDIKNFYKILDHFPFQQLMYRSPKAKRSIYFITDSAKSIIVENEGHVKFINAGVRLFAKIDDKICDCGYRVTQEGIPTLLPYLDPNSLVEISKEELKKLLLAEDHSSDTFSEPVRQKLSTLPNGCCVVTYRESIGGDQNNDIMTLPIVCWKGSTSLRPFVSKNEKIHFLRICGIDTSPLGETLCLSNLKC